MLEVLNEAVATAAVRGPGDPLERKLQTGLVQHMLRKVRLRTDLGRKYRNEAETVQGELQKIHARLHKEHGFVMTGDLLQRDEGAKAVGRFDAGMEIYADAFLLGESAPPEGSVIVTRDSEDAVTCYVRTLTGIVEQRPFPSRTDSQQA